MNLNIQVEPQRVSQLWIIMNRIYWRLRKVRLDIWRKEWNIWRVSHWKSLMLRKLSKKVCLLLNKIWIWKTLFWKRNLKSIISKAWIWNSNQNYRRLIKLIKVLWVKNSSCQGGYKHSWIQSIVYFLKKNNMFWRQSQSISDFSPIDSIVRENLLSEINW